MVWDANTRQGDKYQGSHLESTVFGDGDKSQTPVHAQDSHIRVHTHVLAIATPCQVLAVIT